MLRAKVQFNQENAKTWALELIAEYTRTGKFSCAVTESLRLDKALDKQRLCTNLINNPGVLIAKNF